MLFGQSCMLYDLIATPEHPASAADAEAKPAAATFASAFAATKSGDG
jgi:hypothetical protein